MLARDLITIYCSSSFGPHDDGGIAYYGFVVYCGDVKIEAKYGEYGSGPGVTNNVAEYGTAIKALHWLNDYDEYQGQQVELKSASQLFIRQINGTYGVRAKGIIPLWDEVQELSRPFSVRFVRISGKENAEAKKLSRLARRPEMQYEYEQVPNCDELRWRFALHEASDYVCTISLQRRKGDQWIIDQSAPFYQRKFEQSISWVHYNNFRAKFVGDAGYRKRWRVGGEKDAGD